MKIDSGETNVQVISNSVLLGTLVPGDTFEDNTGAVRFVLNTTNLTLSIPPGQVPTVLLVSGSTDFLAAATPVEKVAYKAVAV